MLDELFMKVFDRSIAAGVVILVVMLARLLLGRVPKVFSYALWGVVWFRLLCPVSLEMPVSLVPEMRSVAEEYVLTEVPISVAGAGEAAYQALGDALNGGLGIQHVRTTEVSADGMTEYVTTDWWDIWILFGQYVWAAGVMVMLLRSAVSYGKLRRKLAVSVPLRERIYIADEIDSPFVLLALRPRIYLPCGLGEKEQEYIILHEKYHIRRLDPLVKVVIYLALCIHWFNPLVWAAFVLTSRDMEMSCDEAVVRQLGEEVRADYGASLLALATGKRRIAGLPLAFGEGDTGSRIRNLAKWKRPAVIVVIAAAAFCVVLGICLIADPMARNRQLLGAEYRVLEVYRQEVVQETPSLSDGAGFCITADYRLYERTGDGEWILLGTLESCAPEAKLWENMILSEDGWNRRYREGKITDARLLQLADSADGAAAAYYLATQTSDGKTLLGYGEGEDALSGEGLQWLARLESVFSEKDRTGSFLDRSLEAAAGADVDVFYQWSNADLPGYLIVGYMAGEAGFQEKTDMGFGVFYHNKEESGYRLLQAHTYEDAALAENGIYLCEHPAVLNLEGELRPESTYDVILVYNDEIDRVTRLYTYADGRTKEYTDLFYNAHNAAVFSWEPEEAGCSVSHYFYNTAGVEVFSQMRFAQEVQPTQASLTGVFDNYLYLSIGKAVYRYERVDTVPQSGKTKDYLMHQFTEDADPEDVEWKVYAIAEVPDLTQVLAVVGEQEPMLYQYSPPKQAAEGALEQLKAAGEHLMVEDGTVTKGKQLWEAFLQASEEGTAASLKLGYYYTLDPASCSKEYYEAYQEDYPYLQEMELHHDQEGYLLCWQERGQAYERRYRYLMQYEGTKPTVTSATQQKVVRYVLTNDNTVTWEELIRGMTSSLLGDGIDFWTVCEEE